MIRKITQNIACAVDSNGYTFKNYDFKFVLPTQHESNDKFISLVKDEIKRQSWQKLIDYKKSGNALRGTIVYLLPEELLSTIGQSSTEFIMKKYPTIDDINIGYDQALRDKEYIEKNSCFYCGQLKENCSILCDGHNE